MNDFYNKYPYTDFHELNLDWIIKRVKQLTADWIETKQAWENTEADWQELYDYVHDYFDNLDVQEEINNKINAMIADGTFVTITTPVIEAKVASMMPGTVASQIGGTVAAQIGGTVANQLPGVVSDQIGGAIVSPVNSWLTEHITQPTTPVVDTSLSISGAAADAAVTGNYITNIMSADESSPLYVYPYNKIYKWDGTATPSETGLTSDLSYINYKDYSDSTGSSYSLYAISAKGLKSMFTADRNYSTTDTVDTDLCLLIDTPVNIGLNIRLHEKNSYDFNPIYVTMRKITTVPAGKHIVRLTGLSPLTAFNSGQEFWNVSLQFTSGVSAGNVAIKFGVINNSYILDYADDISKLLQFKNGAESAPTFFYRITDVYKDYNYTTFSHTALSNDLSYIRYKDYPDGSGSAYSLQSLLAKTDSVLFKAGQAYSEDDAIHTDISLFVNVPVAGRYDIRLHASGSYDMNPIYPTFRQIYNLRAGKQIIKLDNLIALNSIPNNTEFISISVSTTLIDSNSAVFEFGIVSNNYITDMVSHNELYDMIPALDYDTDIIFWGDSLTYGGGPNGVTYCKVCAEELGKTFLNCGVGGETADTIAARQGGNNMIIPAGNVNGTYTEAQLVDMYGFKVTPLRQGGSSMVNPVIINDQECTLTVSQDSPYTGEATYTISGYSGSLDYAVDAIFAGAKLKGDITVIWAGTNGVSRLESRISLIRSMITRTNGKYVILGISSGSDADRTDDDAAMLNEFGNHFFPTRKMLVNYGLDTAGISPTSQDLDDIAAGTVPASLRVDTIHLNASGYTVLGKMVASKIKSLGYV